ncbi:MAG: protein kinase [Acidobacteria bacterium]|nr:protein kinase [Acidobacteriota bacterium]
MVLNYVPGVTLRQVLTEGPLTPNRARRILKGLATALSAVHKAGVAHLDVKPENIMLSDPGTPEERATLLDFGIARLRSAVGGLQAGSQRYMAPEQATHPTIACDIYALGLVAKEMSGGRIPSGIERALRQDPKNRFPSATEFSAALDRVARRQVWNWAAAAAVILGAVFTGWYWNRPPEHFYAKPVPLVTSPGFEQRPALSPDGLWVFYAAGPENRTDIYKQSTAGGNPIPLVVDHANDDRPRPTPDGLGLTFLRHVGKRETIVMLLPLSPAGSAATELTRTTNLEDYSWAPDGNSLVAAMRASDNVPGGLRLYSLATHAWTDLWIPSETGVRFQHPAVSPDGHYLAFSSRKSRSANLFIVSVSSSLNLHGSPRQVTFLNQRIDAIRWTPDSRDLVFLNGPLGLSSLWRVPARGGEPIRISAVSDAVNSFAIAKNAWKLAYSIDPSDDNVWRFHLDRPGAAAMEQVVASTRNDEGGIVSPDGRFLAFLSDRSGSHQIWISRPDGQNPKQITHISDADGVDALWSPDSQSLLISVRFPNRMTVFRTPLSGPVPPVAIFENANLLSFTHDQQSVFFLRHTDSGAPEVWRAPYPALEPASPLPLPGAQHVKESPDGRYLYFTHNHEEDGIFRYTLPAGPIERVVDRLYRRTLFAPSQRGLYYIALPPKSQLPALYLLPNGATKPQLLHRFERELGWVLALSADERSFLFTQTDIGNKDIQLIDRFR